MRKGWMLPGLLLVLAIVVATAGSLGAQSAPPRGGILTLVESADPQTLGAVLTSASSQGYFTGPALEALLGLDWKNDVLVPIPNLAESWKVSPDGLTYTFNLVKNAKWHDGVPFTSADVKFTFQEMTAKLHPVGRTLFQSVTAIEAPDKHTVVLKLKDPFPGFLLVLNQGLSLGVIMPKHLYEGTDYTNNPRNYANLVGTGPFKLVEYRRGAFLRYVRNPDYWRSGMPYLDEVIIRVVPDASTRGTMLRAGEVDAMSWSGVPLSKVKELLALPDLALGSVPQASASLNYLVFNVRNKPLADVRVRRALAHAIDRNLVVDLAQEGLAKVATSNLSSALGKGYWNPSPPYPRLYPFSVDRANALLDEAGYRRGADGKRFKLKYVSGTHQPFQFSVAEVVKQQLAKVGIDLDVQLVDFNAMIDMAYKKWDFDIHSVTITGGPVPEIFISRFYRSDNSVKGVTFNNNAGYANPRVDELFKQAMREANPDVRAKQWYQIQDILAEDLPVLALWEVPQPLLYNKRVNGVWDSPQASQSDMRFHAIYRTKK
jgi:peptide/nickel transport system substrate-binding protein